MIENLSQLQPLGKEDGQLIRATETISSVSHCLRELIENSLDAKAKIINIKIENAGLESITVSDNGSGISRQDFDMLCNEGATSKELGNNNFSGGRGRALGAISKISYLTIESSCDNSGSGYRLTFSKAGERQIQSISRIKGTSVTVHSLFYAYPVRRHYFLQHKTYEFQFIDEVVACFAISTKANITLNFDGKAMTHVYSANFLQRIQSVLGKEVASNMIHGKVDLNSWFKGASAEFYTTPLNAGVNGRIYASVNGRPVINMHIIRSIRYEFKNCNGNRWPVVCLLIKAPREAFEFHPNSPFIGVFFAEIDKLRTVVCSALQDSWLNNTSESPNSSPTTNTTTAPRIKPTRPLCLLGISTVSKVTTNQIVERYKKVKEFKVEAGFRNVVIKQSSFKNMEIIGQWNKAFIVTRLGPDIFAIDQHAACEATNFEKLKKVKSNVKQKLVNPVLLKMQPEDIVNARINVQKCVDLGFEYEIHEEEGGILVKAVPNIKSVATGINDLQEALVIMRDTPHTIPQTQESRSRMAYRACHSSVRVGDTLSMSMMRNILDRMASSILPWNCPHGRPTWCCINTLDCSPAQYMEKLE